MTIFKRASGTGETIITDAGIIATITSDANWNDDGDYTGSVAGLSNGNVYWDDNFNQKYKFDGTTLRRTTYNTYID